MRPGPKSVSERAVTGGDAGIAARASHGEGHVALFGWCTSTSGGSYVVGRRRTLVLRLAMVCDPFAVGAVD